MANESPLRRRRLELGLTQEQLADSATVSRQLVAAVEAGVNTPAVDAALRLAGALDCTAGELFDEEPRQPAGRMGLDSWLPAAGAPLVVAGCDPALVLAEALLNGSGSQGLLALEATTGTALRSLGGGGVHAAIVHGQPGRLQRTRADVIRMQLAHWQVGLGIAPVVDAASLASCLEQAVPIVQRQESAASQQALRRAARALGRELPTAAVVYGHADAARAAMAMRCAAITTEGAALSRGLRFVPLELHTVEIWLERRWEGHRGFGRLGDLLNSRRFARAVSELGGYDLTGCGSLLPILP